VPENKADNPHTSNAVAPVAGDQAILSRRYAESLYALADKEGAVDAVLADMRGLRRLWNECAEWRLIAADPRLSRDEIDAVVAAVLKNCAPGKLTANFVSVVGQNRRLACLPAMIDFFFAEAAAKRGEYHADVRTAHALSAAQRDALTASLSAATGGKVNLSIIEDASILGGLTVKVGSKFIDASVKTRLDLLERTLKGAA
jgi:F-type H+-transporting ATPase subunit delta